MPATPEAVASGIAWKRECGMSHVRAAALVAAVTAFELDGYPVWAGCVTRLVDGAGGPRRAGEDLIDLVRAGLLKEAGQVHQVPLYLPTARGMAMVREWAGDRGEVAA